MVPDGALSDQSPVITHACETSSSDPSSALDPADSLPSRVGLPVEADAAYGEFVGVLQGVLTGGAETIVVAVREDTE